MSSLPARLKKILSKMKAPAWSQDFPIITLWELSVAIKTSVLIRSDLKLHAAVPPMMIQLKFDCDRSLVAEIFMFESVDERTDGQYSTNGDTYVLHLR